MEENLKTIPRQPRRGIKYTKQIAFGLSKQIQQTDLIDYLQEEPGQNPEEECP